MRLRLIVGAFSLVALSMLILAAPTADAQAADDFVITVAVEGSTVIVGLENPTSPVGALDLELSGLGELVGECTITDGLGACNRNGEIVRVVALNPTGWATTTSLVEIETVGEPTDVTITIGQAADVGGVALAGRVSELAAPGDSDASSGGAGWVVPVLLALGIGLAFGVGRRFLSPAR